MGQYEKSIYNGVFGADLDSVSLIENPLAWRSLRFQNTNVTTDFLKIREKEPICCDIWNDFDPNIYAVQTNM